MNDSRDDGDRDERAWAADKRDFVADRRDDIADERDTAADERDATADERDGLATEWERRLDQRERRLDARDATLGLPPQRTQEDRDTAAELHADATAARHQADRGRDQRRVERDTASATRDEATKERQAATPATGLAMAFAEIAGHLYEAENFEMVLTRIVDAAVATITGCDMASLTVRNDGAYHTLASTDAKATEADQAQYDANEGPCLDALHEAVVHVPVLPDPRWPNLAFPPVNHGVQAVASFRLAPTGRIAAGAFPGSLNAYAGTPDAYDDEALEIGLVLASHASTALRAVREREGLELFGRQLHEALSSRDVIGQAKGMLMERLKISPEDAFDTLRRSSQRLNIKLREVAQRLTETGALDPGSGPS